jgi:hypothetical protein
VQTGLLPAQAAECRHHPIRSMLLLCFASHRPFCNQKELPRRFS